jgi:hypothetical protein
VDSTAGTADPTELSRGAGGSPLWPPRVAVRPRGPLRPAPRTRTTRRTASPATRTRRRAADAGELLATDDDEEDGIAGDADEHDEEDQLGDEDADGGAAPTRGCRAEQLDINKASVAELIKLPAMATRPSWTPCLLTTPTTLSSTALTSSATRSTLAPSRRWTPSRTAPSDRETGGAGERRSPVDAVGARAWPPTAQADPPRLAVSPASFIARGRQEGRVGARAQLSKIHSTRLNILGRPIEIAHFWGRCFEAYTRRLNRQNGWYLF